MNRSTLILSVFLVLSAVITSAVFAGGFSMAVEVNPGSSYGKNAILVVKPFGCHKPADAEITGTAEGVVNGERKSIALKFEKNEKGESVLVKQWPNEGAWVITINGHYNGMNSGAIVEMGNNYYLKVDKKNSSNPVVRVFHRKVNSSDFESVLKRYS